MVIVDRQAIADRWNENYRKGKYSGDPPIPFVRQILDVLENSESKTKNGLYVGCGNGRNFIPLVSNNLNLMGIDVSSVAIEQVKEKYPQANVDCIDFRAFSHVPFSYIISIQVFQHGMYSDIQSYFEKVERLLVPKGLLFLRVNSATTNIVRQHEVIEENKFGGKTIQYKEGEKRGLPIHFLSREELMQFMRNYRILSGPIERKMMRTEENGAWTQWEVIGEFNPP